MNPRTFQAIGRPESVILLFDPGRRVIGIKPTFPDDPESVRVMAMKDGYAEFILTEFLNTYNIPLPSSIRFLDAHVQNETLILDLNRTTPVKGSRKNGRTQTESQPG
ncbi:MAG TPA: hypothetical protein VGO43_11020 [Pyrinomonadaceae bacterium]|jgi:hypothetical protein|nr:hypothetical protein [Pyrinomonadaceae bacterium]